MFRRALTAALLSLSCVHCAASTDEPPPEVVDGETADVAEEADVAPAFYAAPIDDGRKAGKGQQDFAVAPRGFRQVLDDGAAAQVRR